MKVQTEIRIIAVIVFSFSLKTFSQAPTPVGPIPNARQVEWYHREVQAFFHFGINTFGDNVNEGDGKANPEIFNPTALDCNQWMRVLNAAGIKCGILVAKHGDGFCNWPSAYTDYSVKNSPWRGGEGDLVKEYTNACNTAGIKAGIYLGPFDRHQHLSPSYSTSEYSTYYASQLSELMRNYGTIWETWWDGAGADELTTPIYSRWADTIRNIQPECVIFGTKNSYRFADCRWVGNESGFAGDPCWATIDSFSIRDESNHLTQLNLGEKNGNAYIPAESDVSLRPSWFYHASEDGQAKSASQLFNIYMNSVGHNSVLLLNLSPDRRGLITADDSSNVNGLYRWIKGTFQTNLASGAVVTSRHPRSDVYSPSNMVDALENTYYATTDAYTTDTIVFILSSEKLFDCIMLQEVIQLGHRTTGWSVDYSTNGTDWIAIPQATGKTCIGYKWMVRFNPVTASYVRLRITSGIACPAIHTFGIYKQTYDQTPVTNIEDAEIPDFFNFPNPFTETTTISYQLTAKSNVKINVYDVLGREVINLVNETNKLPDTYTVQWNAANLSNGIYLVNIEVPGYYKKTIKFSKL